MTFIHLAVCYLPCSPSILYFYIKKKLMPMSSDLWESIVLDFALFLSLEYHRLTCLGFILAFFNSCAFNFGNNAKNNSRETVLVRISEVC